MSITAVEGVSASGKVIPPFLIIPGVRIQVRWVTNDLREGTTITTSPKGYINDIIAIK